MTTILSPYTGSGILSDPYRPLIEGSKVIDITNRNANDIKLVNGSVLVDASGVDISADTRFVDMAAPTKARLDNQFYPDVSTAIMTAADATSKTLECITYPVWRAGLAVSASAVYLFTDKNLYRVIQAHTTQADWTPPVAKALFVRYYEPTDAPWPWVQPTGAHDAYPIGARVTDGGYTWQNTIAANVWRPGVTGWTNLTPPPVSPNWSGAGVAYKVNDLVIYVPNGFTYKCLQAHTSQAGWTPVAVPALWQKV